jgi:hypothetical protein
MLSRDLGKFPCAMCDDVKYPGECDEARYYDLDLLSKKNAVKGNTVD